LDPDVVKFPLPCPAVFLFALPEAENCDGSAARLGTTVLPLDCFALSSVGGEVLGFEAASLLGFSGDLSVEGNRNSIKLEARMVEDST
jgi:hypothetical protein